ncbi:MAG: dihydropteroate synthase [Abditibacteriaceae bacterium]
MDYWKCGSHQFDLSKKTLVMGIVNATPDSFSGDGKLGQIAIDSALRMIDDGADILDIGGESTRPGADKISAQCEIDRILPLVKVLSQYSIPLSIDTTKAEVAKAALEHGASIINDISGGTFDEKMLSLIASTGCGYVIMHLRGTPQTMQWSEKPDNATKNVIAEIIDFWKIQIESAIKLGVDKTCIALDPGFGFGKSIVENMETLRRGKELGALGHPLLCAVSRKSTIGKILAIEKPEERIWGSAACAAIAINNGYNILRVHNVREMKQVAQMADAIGRNHRV